MIEVFKREIEKFLKEIYVNTNKQGKKMNQTLQDLKVEIESSQTVGNQEIKSLGTQIGTTEASFTNRI